MAKKSFTINRKKWLRGEGEDNSRLLRSIDNKMCCLGFFEKAICGLKNKDILDKYDPTCLMNESKQPKWFYTETKFGRNYSLDLDTLIQLNDSKDLTPSVREELIKNIFKKNGITVKFVG